MPLIKGKSEKSFKNNVETEMHHDKPLKQSLAIAYAMKRKAQHKAKGGDMCAHGGEARCMAGCYDGGGDVQSSGPAIDPEKVKQFEKGFNAGGGSLSDAYDNAKKALGYAKGGEMGVNKTIGIRGRSEAGAKLNPAFSVFGKEGDTELAKDEHRKTLAELKSMPKPELMGEGGEMEDINQLGDEDEGEGDMDSIHPMVRRIMMGMAKGYSEGGKVANEESGESTDEPSFAKADGNEFDDLALRDDLEFDSTGANEGDSLDDAEQDHEREDIVSRIMRSRAKKDRMSVPGEGSSYGRRK